MTGRGRWVDPFAGIPGRRLFIAVPLDAAAREAVTGIVETVRAQPLPAGERDVRWVRLDGLHLTLRFLGPTTDERIGPTTVAMRTVATSTPRATGRFAGTGVFPPGGRPRTLWIGIDDGAPTLDSLARDLNGALETAGWPPDDRLFRAHLTLARSDGIAAGSLVAGRLAAALGDRSIPFAIDRLVLYESVTGVGAARYVPVTEAPLSDRP